MHSHIQRFLDKRHDDAGVAMLVAISLMGIVSVLMLSILAFTLRETSSTGRDRQRSSGVASAEAAVDLTLAQMTNGSISTLPCGTQAPVTITGAAPDIQTVVTTIDYFTATSDVPLDCASVASTGVAGRAVLKSIATSNRVNDRAPSVRTFQTEVKLTPLFDKNLTKAIFGNSGITLSNNGDVFGENGTPNADLYTNGSFSCSNNQHYHGSVYATGSISLSNTCVIDVDAYAGTGFTASSPASSVGGRVLVASGNATLVAAASVGQTVRTSGTISWPSCTPTKCFPGVVVPPVPTTAFPIINSNAYLDPGWAANGFTNVLTVSSLPAPYNNCAVSGKMNGPGQWIVDKGGTLLAGTILINACAQGIVVDTPSNVVLSKDLAVFSQGPILFAKANITSDSATVRKLYLIQAYDAVALHPCTTIDGITLSNQVTIDNTVDELLYTPCNIVKANNSTHYGQIYAGGNVQINNKLTMYYQPVPVWGVANSSNQVVSYSSEIVYQRENSG